jgi:hypothetical protein
LPPGDSSPAIEFHAEIGPPAKAKALLRCLYLSLPRGKTQGKIFFVTASESKGRF